MCVDISHLKKARKRWKIVISDSQNNLCNNGKISNDWSNHKWLYNRFRFQCIKNTFKPLDCFIFEWFIVFFCLSNVKYSGNIIRFLDITISFFPFSWASSIETLNWKIFYLTLLGILSLQILASAKNFYLVIQWVDISIFKFIMDISYKYLGWSFFSSWSIWS